MNQKISLDIQVMCKRYKHLPKRSDFLFWLHNINYKIPFIYIKPIEIVIRLVNKKESSKLNFIYKKKNNPTNILSFPFCSPDFIKFPILGDLVICSSIIKEEAIQQNKNISSHWAHIVIHGMLHLLGYDHVQINDKNKMESTEIKIMKQIGFDNPYIIK